MDMTGWHRKLYHADSSPPYESDIYYDIHPRLDEYAAALEPCTDPDCARAHFRIDEPLDDADGC